MPFPTYGTWRCTWSCHATFMNRITRLLGVADSSTGGTSGKPNRASPRRRKVNFTLLALALDVHQDDLAGLSSPKRILSDRASSISRWIVRRSGRAPSTGS